MLNTRKDKNTILSTGLETLEKATFCPSLLVRKHGQRLQSIHFIRVPPKLRTLPSNLLFRGLQNSSSHGAWLGYTNFMIVFLHQNEKWYPTVKRT